MLHLTVCYYHVTYAFPNRFARSPRTSLGFFGLLRFVCEVVGVSKDFVRAVYNAALASLS